MGDYATVSDLQDRYPAADLVAYFDLDEDGTADTDAMSDAIDEAEATINSYVGRQYDIPVSGSTRLKHVAIAEAMYEGQKNLQSVTDDARQEHEENLAWLRDVASGKAVLDTATRPSSSNSAGSIEAGSVDSVFGRTEPL